MSTTGNTYIPAGLMWGWATLSKNAPYDQAEDAINGQKVRKIMVLMTDGFNTLSPTVPHNGSHFGSDTAQSNTYTQELCSNIKAQKVTIYTVAFDVTDANIKSILESCASSPGNYFDASNASELQEAFEKIAADFSPLRLTRVVAAFETQLEAELKANDLDYDEAGRLKFSASELADEIGDAKGGAAAPRISYSRRRRYGELHIAARVRQMDSLLERIAAIWREASPTRAVLSTRCCDACCTSSAASDT